MTKKRDSSCFQFDSNVVCTVTYNRKRIFSKLFCYSKMHEQEKKRQHATRVLEIEKGTSTPLLFTTTGGMGEECLRYHGRLAELLAMKKGEDYAKTMNWIRVKISFSLIRSALVCLRGSRSIRRKPYNIMDIDTDVQTAESGIRG